ncbi:tripartite tricarboxylate transporter substrate binding protein [Roseomonas terrae]|uniref:Tripartite tricarboxylate transporter substrate binding protein n=1 Tax=Neoroseomonas terrae TaxID=424799 RepID=A0ABS5EGJ9_9PROT|nr:tripartite tricarboxylate transporter substrate binding protein [Neoroseomonas terrae]MBR0650148.1 tripartite tricarboxylate transporter substrate binding protein [Neoroseomonas terrae]
MRIDRRGAVATLAGLVAPWPLRAQNQAEFPDRPIRIIVPASAGSGSDTLARIIATGMRQTLPQPTLVENRAGGGGIPGTEAGARAAPDGYTITLGSSSSLGANAALSPYAKYVVERDFAPLAGVARSYYVICTGTLPNSPRTLAELVARMRDGDESFAAGSLGTIGHLTQELFLRRAGVRATQITYRSGSTALSDLAAGRVIMGCDTLAPVMPFIQGGRVRALAVTAPQRLAGLPDVPTTAEAGIPNLVVDTFFGLVAPAATPAPIRAKLTEAILAAVNDPEARRTFDTLMLDPMPIGPAAFGPMIRDTTAFWTGFLNEAGIRIEF